MVALTNFSDMVKTSIKEGADIIFAGAGLPLDLPGYLRDGARTKLVPIISSARAAAVICKKWLSRFDYLPDAFVANGLGKSTLLKCLIGLEKKSKDEIYLDGKKVSKADSRRRNCRNI